jgi:hypothetical protein
VYIVLYPRFFIFQVCDVAKLEIIHKKIKPNLAIDNIILKNNPLMFWLLAKTCCRNLAILIFF